ncbi:prokaryotic phospholipase A2-domain-containing protein [Copromyces sp. CBS 386.78]|nr:prokaryotic phospholipase A2-domain-containing protein [Copromyces sp. CBS 386.78]
MKAFSFLPLLATVFMSFMLATTALPGLPLENRSSKLDAKKKPKEPHRSSANPPNTGYVLQWCKYTAGMIFQWDLPTFIKHREKKFSLGPLTWDWSSDGCTGVVDNPLGFPLKPACQRHDFAYRNYKVQYRLTPHARYQIDQNFLKDMLHQCEGQRSDCRDVWARGYYWGVRHFYKHHEQYREDAPKVKLVDISASKNASQSTHVFEGMDADEARDAANEHLPEEKVKEYYDRALERIKRAVAEAQVKGAGILSG